MTPPPDYTIHPAADQDGYDGGYVARQGELEAWGKTAQIALVALMGKVLEESQKKDWKKPK